MNSESGRYFAVGMDVPAVRVFDTATGELCCLVEPDKKKFSNSSVLRSAGALTGTAFAVSLSCVALQEAHSKVTKTDVVLAAGLSDGSLVLHNVTRDAAIGHIAISDHHQSVLSVAISNGLCFALTRGGKLFVVDIDAVSIVAGPFECPKTATNVAVAAAAPHHGGKKQSRADSALVLVAGPTSSIFRLVAASSQQYNLEVVCSFATQATPVNFSWISPDGSAAVTCGAQEGVVRVWDLALEGSRPTAVCKRSLPAGHRVGHLRVHQRDDSAIIAVTTFLGQILLFDLGTSLVPRVTDPMPLEPSAICVSATAPGKLLLGDINHTTKQLITIRGRFAVPRFESRDVATVLADATTSSSKTTSLGLLSHGKQADDAAAGTFAVDVDNEWASHHAVATRAIITAAEDFAVPKAYHADSVAQLPTASSLSLESQQSSRGAPIVGASLGSVTVPLYQALHAGDESLVMELMSVSARSEADVAACIASLQLPYVLHLLKILSKRVQATTARSPVYLWISAIIQLRGAEMYAAQQAQDAERLQQAKGQESGVDGDAPKAFVAPLLAHYRNMTSQYDKLALAYGRLSIFRSVNPLEDRHGKKKRNIVAPEHAVADGIVFPKMFSLIDGDGTRGGPKIVRLRSKLERQALEARRKRSSKKARVEGEDLDDDAEDIDLSDDDMSLNSEEMDAMLNDGELSLGKPKGGKRAGGDAGDNLIAEDEDGSDVEDRNEDFDDMSDDLVDSDEESEGSASEVDSSPFEEEEDNDAASDDLGAEDSDEEGSDDEDDGGDDNEDDGGNYALNTRRSQNERRLRTD